MKTIIFISIVVALVSAQDGIKVTSTWPENWNTPGGAIMSLVFENLNEGSCVITLPGMVRMFHVMNGHINSNSDEINVAEGIYKISAPAHWEAVNGTFNILVLFNEGEVYNLTESEYRCDPSDVEDISVYSFPQNDEKFEASSNVYYRPGFHAGDVLTITLPAPVDRFNFTTMDSRYTVETSGNTYTLSGFQNGEGVDDMKEVHFSIYYANATVEEENWFAAGDVSVTVTREDEDDE